jgi:uncharacterized protein (DUF1778 family)
VLVLTARETETFINALLHPPQPGTVLRKATRRYRESFGTLR